MTKQRTLRAQATLTGPGLQTGKPATVILKAASAQIEKGDLFREKGKGGDGNSAADTPFNEAMRLAAELVSKSKDMTNEQALQRVFLEHPELYAAYARSVSAGANADRD